MFPSRACFCQRSAQTTEAETTRCLFRISSSSRTKGAKVLTRRGQRPAPARPGGRLRRLRRRPGGHPRGGGARLPRAYGADLRHSHQVHASLATSPYTDRERFAADLGLVSSATRTSRTPRAGSPPSRGRSSSTLPDDQRLLSRRARVPDPVPSATNRPAPASSAPPTASRPRPPGPQDDQDHDTSPNKQATTSSISLAIIRAQNSLEAPLPLAQRAPRS